MASIDDLLLSLHPPWSASAKSILFNGHDDLKWDDLPVNISGFIVVDHVCQSRLTGNIASLKPFEGLVVNQPERECVIELGTNTKWFCEGMWIGFSNLKVLSQSPLVLFPELECSVWCIPEYDFESAITYMNLFSGAFAGWERATTWLKYQKLSHTFKSISVDFEPQVMDIWSKQINKPVLQRPVHVGFSSEDTSIGILTCVSDPTILNLWRSAYNGIFTCSPPCQSWSKGGKGSGLEPKNGQSFIKAINCASKARPVAVLVECSDLLPKHPHYQIVRACFSFAGYKLVYSGTLKLEDLAPMMRSRWFAIWVRQDIKHSLPKQIACSDPCKVGWNHPMYRFFIPEQLAHLLEVSAELTEMYGSFKFLPVGMRGQCGNPNDSYAVLLSRCINENDNFPTLCASYGSQHELDLQHIRAKGIFAPLILKDGSFWFIDPFRCATLLGATPHFGTAFSVDLIDAWSNLGNSVSVPQALHAILILLHSIGLCHISIPDIVLQCWNDRFNAKSTIIGWKHCLFWFLNGWQLPGFLINDDFPCDDALKTHDNGQPISFRVDSNYSFLQLFGERGLCDPEKQGLSLLHGLTQIDWSSNVGILHGESIACLLGDMTIFTFSIDAIIPPTLPWVTDDETFDHDLLDAVAKAESDNISLESQLKKAKTNDSFDNFHPLDPKCVRLAIAFQNGVNLGDDEFDFFLKTFATCNSKFLFLAPVTEPHGLSRSWTCSLSDLINDKIDCICFPILVNNHWCGIEFRKQGYTIVVTMLNVRQKDRRTIERIRTKICGQSTRPLTFHDATLPVPDGWCGWALVNRWAKLSQCEVFDVALQYPSEKLRSLFGEPNNIASAIVSLAYAARLYFLLQHDHHVTTPASIRFGAAEDEDMSEKPKDIDPWLKTDPWATKKNCKWEDLKLPTDHPIHDGKGTRLDQHHRHQLGTNLGGVAFTTRSMIPEVIGQQPKKPFALLVPASDKLNLDPSFNLHVTGPHEIIVEDTSSGSTYKRQVMMAQIGKEISFKLAKPTYTAVLVEMSEIVLEIDARLALKETISSFKDKPLESFKAKVIDQFPSKTTKNLNVYGFKHFKENLKKDQSEFYQAMCKIPTSERKAFLERSGIGEICARDFVPKGDVIRDATIVPRFWQCDKTGKEEAVRAAASLTGFGGLIITKRGIAVRAWVNQVGSIRSILMPHDDRICDINRDVVPVTTRESTGWPSSISATEVVKATFHATSQAPVPTRCYRSLGLTTWTLGFATPPAISTFLAQFNDQTYEILISEPDPPAPKAKVTKGKGKGKNQQNPQKTAPFRSEPVDQVLTDRVACLEAKFGGLERRQDQLEHRITTGFDGVQDQLRQVLQAVAPKQGQASTGLSPPPKVAKTS